jgi:starch synthase
VAGRIAAARKNVINISNVDRDLKCKPAAFELGGATQQAAAAPPAQASLFLKAPSAPAAAAPKQPRDAPATLRNIVFVSSEAAPWSKTGGLGDVIGSLPAALAARGHRVMVVAPRYEEYAGVNDTGVRARLLGHDDTGFFHRRERGVDWVFVDHPSYRRPGGIYADAHGPYGDNQFRFALLCLAGCEAPLLLPLQRGDDKRGKGEEPPSTYGQDVTFVANDWHAALVPVYLAAKYRPHGVYGGARALLAIHNLKHQGVYPPGSYRELGLPAHWYGALEWQYPPHQRLGSYAEEGRSVNHLKAGIATADRLLTVSPGAWS